MKILFFAMLLGICSCCIAQTKNDLFLKLAAPVMYNNSYVNFAYGASTTDKLTGVALKLWLKCKIRRHTIK